MSWPLLLAQASEAGGLATRLTAWVVAVVLVLIAWAASRTAPLRWLRQAAWVLVAPAVLLAAYGTPPVWERVLGIAETAWTDAFGPVWARLGPLAAQPLSWGVLFGAAGLWLALPSSTGRRRVQGLACGLVAVGFLAAATPGLGGLGPQLFYWILAGVTLFAAGVAICARSPVYSAIWFALSLAGVSGLFFYNGAQFLGAATIVVYAGAIIVTFLFVIMLAQPEGHATYDRISWAKFPQPLSLLAAAGLVGALAFAVGGANSANRRQDLAYLVRREANRLESLSMEQVAGLEFAAEEEGRVTATVTLRGDVPDEVLDRFQQELAAVLAQQNASLAVRRLSPQQDTLTPSHMANFGGRLFAVHTVSVELAGALLLVALVGAVAIVIHGRQPYPARPVASQD